MIKERSTESRYGIIKFKIIYYYFKIIFLFKLGEERVFMINNKSANTIYQTIKDVVHPDTLCAITDGLKSYV